MLIKYAHYTLLLYIIMGGSYLSVTCIIIIYQRKTTVHCILLLYLLVVEVMSFYTTVPLRPAIAINTFTSEIYNIAFYTKFDYKH